MAIGLQTNRIADGSSGEARQCPGILPRDLPQAEILSGMQKHGEREAFPTASGRAASTHGHRSRTNFSQPIVWLCDTQKV